jgi:hypothetical protein
VNYATHNLTSDVSFVLAQKGIFKQIQIAASQANGITVTPVINSGDFLHDTETACSLDDISPAEACAVLEDLATEIEKSITRGDTQDEPLELNLYLLVLNRLHNWKKMVIVRIGMT